MNSLKISKLIFLLLSIILINLSLTTSKSVWIKKNDPEAWRESQLGIFNSIYAITMNEKYLRYDGLCNGKCDGLQSTDDDENGFVFLDDPNKCVGIVRYCWFKEETEERKQALEELRSASVAMHLANLVNRDTDAADIARYKYDRTGNICECMCEHTDYPYTKTKRSDLLDSFCMDPVTVDDGFVATGVRFTRDKNIIYLELQEALLSENGLVDKDTLRWKRSGTVCENPKRVIDNIANGGYNSLKIILEDLSFPENVVVTGVAFTKLLKGRYLSENGEINDDRQEIIKETQCHGSTNELIDSNNLMPSTTAVGNDNEELSKSCRDNIKFVTTSSEIDDQQHVVPYVDLREVVTDPPTPIRGIGWYYRGVDGYGGYLALKIYQYKH